MLEDSLTIFMIHSPCGINWKGPKKLFWSTAINHLMSKTRRLGHAMVRVRCSDYNGNPIEVWSGVTDTGQANIKLLIKDKLGLGTLFDGMPGKMESGELLQVEAEERIQSKTINYIQYKIAKSTSQRLIRYQKEFVENSGFHTYGLPCRPRYLEGAGCSAYAVSYLELAGILSDEHFKDWSYTVNVPEKYIGGKTTGRKVSFFSLLLMPFWTKWGREDQAHKKVFFWDPDTMYRHTEKLLSSKDSVTEDGRGICYDFSNIATPDYSIWKIDT
jgi:hypothetical protein